MSSVTMGQGIWGHLGGIWVASGASGWHLAGIWLASRWHLGGIWETSGGYLETSGSIWRVSGGQGVLEVIGSDLLIYVCSGLQL